MQNSFEYDDIFIETCIYVALPILEIIISNVLHQQFRVSMRAISGIWSERANSKSLVQ